MKRNEAFIREWIVALRSGEYEQTKRALHRIAPVSYDTETYPPGYCCLGVACTISDKVISRVVRVDVLGGGMSREEEEFKFEDDHLDLWLNGVLSSKMLEYIGITQSEHDNLIHMNDHGYSFNEIADFLETLIK